MIYWGEHRFVMGTKGGWQSTKIGAGPIPIETPEGWLMIYHGVLTSCNGFVYAFGAALAFCKMDELLAWLRANSAVQI
jgi:beta-1,4-mannooligosaccharide/beta-1,4-mannosyl-N-acetylglucosamine phosphorylase